MLKVSLLLVLLSLIGCGNNASLKVDSKGIASSELQAVISKPIEGLVASDVCGRKQLEELYCEPGESLVLTPISQPPEEPIVVAEARVAMTCIVPEREYTCVKDSLDKSAVQTALSEQTDLSDLVCEKQTVDELLCDPGQSLILLRKCGTEVPASGKLAATTTTSPTGSVYRCSTDSAAP